MMSGFNIVEIDGILCRGIEGMGGIYVGVDDPLVVFRDVGGRVGMRRVNWHERVVCPGKYRVSDFPSKWREYKSEYIAIRTVDGIRYWTKGSWLRFLGIEEKSADVSD